MKRFVLCRKLYPSKLFRCCEMCDTTFPPFSISCHISKLKKFFDSFLAFFISNFSHFLLWGRRYWDDIERRWWHEERSKWVTQWDFHTQKEELLFTLRAFWCYFCWIFAVILKSYSVERLENFRKNIFGLKNLKSSLSNKIFKFIGKSSF